MKRILILGITSAIAEECAKLFVKKADVELIIVGRNAERTLAIQSDLSVRLKKNVHARVTDLSKIESHEELLGEIELKFGEVDVALIAYGVLNPPLDFTSDFSQTASVLQTNFTSHASLIHRLADRFSRSTNPSSKVIAVISSVAGDRVRGSNHVYGTSKCALDGYLSGVRAKLSRTGVTVLTIKPGFVDTPMTEDMKKGLLWASPQLVAKEIVAAIEKKRLVIYTPSFWRMIMFIIRHIPERIFMKLKF